MTEMNPNHPMTQDMRDQWHKITAMLMLKFGVTETTITAADVLSMPIDTFIVIEETKEGLQLKLVSEAEAQRLVKKEGGAPH